MDSSRRGVATARIRPAARATRLRHRFIDAVAWWRRMPLLWRLLPAFAYGAAIGLGLAWYESERVVPLAALELSWDAPAPGQAPSASEPLEEQQPATRADAEDARIEVERRQYGRSRPIGDSPHVRYRGQIIDYRTPPIY